MPFYSKNVVNFLFKLFVIFQIFVILIIKRRESSFDFNENTSNTNQHKLLLEIIIIGSEKSLQAEKLF